MRLEFSKANAGLTKTTGSHSACCGNVRTGGEQLGIKTPLVTLRRVDAIPRQDSGKLKRFVPLRGGPNG
jgi:hypothetical protein